MSELCCFTTGLSARRRAKRAHAQSRARLQETGARLEDKELLMILLSSEGRRGAHLLLCYQFTDLPNTSEVATCSYSLPFIPLLPLFHLCIKHNGLRFLYLHNVRDIPRNVLYPPETKPPPKKVCLNVRGQTAMYLSFYELLVINTINKADIENTLYTEIYLNVHLSDFLTLKYFVYSDSDYSDLPLPYSCSEPHCD